MKGRTLGVVGLGNIGSAVAERAHAFELNIIAWSRSLTPDRTEAAGVGYRKSPQAAAADASIVTPHVASTPEIHHLADRALFDAMSDRALSVNTIRAAVVGEDALAWALNEKDLRARLDVMQGEPAEKQGNFDHPLADHLNVYMTPYIGTST